MKKIVNKIIYDTEKAKILTSYHNGLYPNDFEYLSEELYLTKNGKFFLCCKGGGDSNYAEHCEEGSSLGRQKIIPLTKEETYKWLEEKEEVELIEELFVNEIQEA